jgi:hypothetical protein
LPSLNNAAREHIGGGNDFNEIQELIFKPTREELSSIMVGIVCLPIVVIGLIASGEYLRTFGLRGITDPLHWMVFIGAMWVAVYGVIGTSFALRAVKLVRKIVEVKTKPAIYHRDCALGMTFLGRFALSTNFMYLSGWLLVPALMVSLRGSSAAPVLVSHLVLGFGYAAMGLLLFMWPIYIVHKRIQAIKEDLAGQYGEKAEKCQAALMKKFDIRSAERFDVARSIYRDVQNVSNWPLGLDVIFRFTLTAILLPLVVNIAAVWWATPRAP